MKQANKIFSVFFLVLAIAETIGFIGGLSHCLYVAILCFGLSIMFYADSFANHNTKVNNPLTKGGTMKR